MITAQVYIVKRCFTVINKQTSCYLEYNFIYVTYIRIF